MNPARTLLCAFFLAAVFGLPCAAQQKPDNSLCAACHDQAKKIDASGHAQVACIDCHPKHDELPHPTGLAKPTCASCHAQIGEDYRRSAHGSKAASDAGAPDCSTCHGGPHELATTKSMAFRKEIPDTCGICHSQIAADFKASTHGQALASGVVAAPVCNDCHGEHLILAKTIAESSVNARHIRETCANCHGNVSLSRRFGLPPDRVTSFDSSFHGLALVSGTQTVANCASCHGFHNILKAQDPRSTVNPKNLAATCGKCHPGAGDRFALGPIHQSEGTTEPAGVTWVRRIYLIAIPLVIGWMLLHNFGDWLRKLIRSYRGASPARLPGRMGELRMLRFERMQHAAAGISFLVLSWTGFALKYPLQWWARPLLAFETQWPVRRMVHRGAAIVLIAAAVLHVLSLIFDRRLREHWLHLIPRLGDASDAARNTAYNLGLTSKQPKLPSHSYIQKAEYWAVVWGTFIMSVTGLLLWANTYVLRWFPKATLDISTAVHFYEAALAGLAVIAWHLYGVILDPDVYPLDTAWLTGHSARNREAIIDPAEAPKPPSVDPL